MHLQCLSNSAEELDLACERTRNQAADIVTECFTGPLAWTKVLHLVNIVTGTHWDSHSYKAYLQSMLDDGLPVRPGGFAKPRIGPQSRLRDYKPIAGKISEKTKRLGKGRTRSRHLKAAGQLRPRWLKARPRLPTGHAAVARCRGITDRVD